MSEQPPRDDSELSFDDIPLPDDDSALQALSQLGEDVVRPIKVTPKEERYDPLAPNQLTHDEAVQQQVIDTQLKPKPSRAKRWLYNLVSLLAIFGTITVCAWYTIIWQNPQSQLNPFPPATEFYYVTATPAPTLPNTLAPNETPQVNITTLPSVLSTPTLAVTTDPDLAQFPFRTDEPLYIANANGRECNWASIAGSVTGVDGQAVDGLGIRITGADIASTVFSGATRTFGPGGYELNLGGAPQAGDFTVQLFSSAGAPLSDEITVTTRAECSANVLILNFLQLRDF